VAKLLRGELSALISLCLSLLELYEIVRRWLEARTRQEKEQPLELAA
jgi:hypothetical protein